MGRLKRFTKKSLDLLRDTAIEVLIVGSLGTPFFTYKSHQYETKRTQNIHLCFSEKTQMEKEAEALGITLSSGNYFLPNLNDGLMKIFESSNKGHSPIYMNFNRGFAQELEDHLFLNNIYHTNLQDILDTLPKMADVLYSELYESGYVDARIISKNIRDELDDSWRKEYVDNYHYETVTTVNSDGEEETEEVKVDDIDDTYVYYYPEHGELADSYSKELFFKIHSLIFNTNFFLPSQTNPDGEYAAEQSRGVDLKGGLSKEQLLKISHSWYTGSTMKDNVGSIHSNYLKMNEESKLWSVSKKTSGYHHYVEWGEHPGPKEYIQAQDFEHISNTTYHSIDELLSGIELVIKEVPILEKTLHDYHSVVFFGEYEGEKLSKHQRKKLENKLQRNILGTTRLLYSINFKNAEEPFDYRDGMVFLFTLLGLGVSCSLGYAIDRLTTHFNIYDKISLRVLGESSKKLSKKANDKFKYGLNKQRDLYSLSHKY